jgi:hypothetical protein
VVKDAPAPETAQNSPVGPVAMTYEIASAYTNRDNVLYIDLPTDKLEFMRKELETKLLRHDYIGPNVQVAEDKLAAVKMILAKRAEAQK